MKDWLIVTDLDGTLLDDSYPVKDAAAALAKAEEIDSAYGIVLASSKTLAEMQVLAEAVDRPLYLIFENGAGVAWQDGLMMRGSQPEIGGYRVVKFCLGYRQVCEVLELQRFLGYPFIGFSGMTAHQVAKRTGLTVSAAKLAKQRLFSEPIVWQGDKHLLTRFKRSLGEYGLTIQLGGRFHHVSSGANKATALAYLRSQIRLESGVKTKVLACGDAPNDLEIINKADHALVFPQRSGEYIRQQNERVWHALQPGPVSWLSSVQKILASRGVHA
ncbi:MAG: HAD hydrolase family protein [Pseudomonadota bacterium]